MLKTLQRINRIAIHPDDPTCSESDHQRCVIDWATDTEPLIVDELKREALHWLHSIPNGGGRGKPFKTRSGKLLPNLEAVKMKNEGQKTGVSDLRLDYVKRDPRNMDRVISPGLVIEMKKPGGTLSKEQRDYFKFMQSQTFECHKCDHWQEAAIVIARYLELQQIAPVYYRTGQQVRTLTRLQ